MLLPGNEVKIVPGDLGNPAFSIIKAENSNVAEEFTMSSPTDSFQGVAGETKFCAKL
jgi:hypothetical protein